MINEAAGPDGRPTTSDARLRRFATLSQRLSRCSDLDQVLTEALVGLDEMFGFRHSMLLILDEADGSLYTIASHGYERAGIGSEVVVGQGIIGMVAARGRPIHIGNMTRMVTYARAVQRSSGSTENDREIPMPGLASVGSQLAAPAMVMGHLRGVLAVESEELGAFSSADESLLVAVAFLLANAIELDTVVTSGPASEGQPSPAARRIRTAMTNTTLTSVRFFPTDGSVFVDGEYLIKGVAGRILWRLLSDYQENARTEFTNREVRLDPALELPSYRDNLESRLILLKRRLEERDAAIRIDKNGRGRFRLVISGRLLLERRDDS